MANLGGGFTGALTGLYMLATGQVAEPELDYIYNNPELGKYAIRLSEEGNCKDLGIVDDVRTATLIWNPERTEIYAGITHYESPRHPLSLFNDAALGCVKFHEEAPSSLLSYPSDLFGQGFYEEEHGKDFVQNTLHEIDNAYKAARMAPPRL